MLQQLVQILIEKGYDAKTVTTTKGGIYMQGISLQKGDIGYIFYPEIEDLPLETYANQLIQSFHNCTFSPNFQELQLTDWHTVKPKLYLCIRPKIKDNIITKPFYHLEFYVKILLQNTSEGIYSVKVTEDLLEMWNITEKQLFDIAAENSKPNFTITELFPEFYVLTNKDKFDGASAFYFPEIFSSFAKLHHLDHFLIIPSSIHELILVPIRFDILVDEYQHMVKDVNQSGTVLPEEQLGNYMFQYQESTKTFSVIDC